MCHFLFLTILFCPTQHFLHRAEEERVSSSKANTEGTTQRRHEHSTYLLGRRAAARLPGRAGRRRASAPGCSSAARPRWSCAGPPQTAWSSAVPRRSFPSSKGTTESSVQNGISASVKKTDPHVKPRGRKRTPALQRVGHRWVSAAASQHRAITGSYRSHSFL